MSDNKEEQKQDGASGWKVADGELCKGDDIDKGPQGATKDKDNKPSLLEQTTSNQTTSDWLTGLFKKNLNLTDQPTSVSVLDEVTFEGIARYINSDKCQKIVTMAGAGISTSAGIPDFRSPGTGLYDNLQKYNLPNPQAVFDISYFRENPEPFFMLCKQLFPAISFKPTACHYFIKLLEKKNKLLRHFTQNIDTLERLAGLGDDRLVEAHGTFNTAHCLQCQHQYTQEWVKERLFDEKAESVVPKCEQEDCDGVVKPDIVFFGECLPKTFSQRIADLPECDLLIIMGTSLVVQPFASLTSRVNETTPRLYINMENTQASGPVDPFMALFGGGGGFNFDGENNIRDVFWQGKCDDGCFALAKLLGWEKELETMVNEGVVSLDQQKAAL